MKEKIYTIPVMDTFKEDCECPLCVLEKKYEENYVEYMLGPSLMEPDARTETNAKGFCREHFTMLYNRQLNKLGLGLVIDTHMVEVVSQIKALYEGKSEALRAEAGISTMKALAGKFSGKQGVTAQFIKEMDTLLNNMEHSCALCDKLNFTMDRYLDVVLYLWFSEAEFKALYDSRKGFCIKHTRSLLCAAQKYLDTKKQAIFVDDLMSKQVAHLSRIQEEVNWFTKKFDYRYNDAPWGNSRDALPRSIQKLCGTCDLK